MKRIIYGLVAVCLLMGTPVAFTAKAEPIVNYQVLFSPDDNIADELISLIQAEKKSVKAAVYCLMHRGISQALIDAYKRGVQVEVIVDPYSVKSRSPVKKMGAAHLPIFVWNPFVPDKQSKKGKVTKSRKPLMHDKFCVLGDSRVWTGSFNFTFEAASSNRENVVILESSEIAARYLEEFNRLKKAGCVPLQEYLAQKNQSVYPER